MIKLINYQKDVCKNKEAFNCDKGNTNCKLCGFFEEKDRSLKDDGSTLLFSSPLTTYNYDFIFKEIKEVKEEMEELRKMLGEQYV